MGDGIEKNLVLDRFPYIIGKNSSLVDGILLAQTVSRVHARILQENDTLFLEDHNSTNGTYLNGHLIPMNTRMPLQEGDLPDLCHGGICVKKQNGQVMF